MDTLPLELHEHIFSYLLPSRDLKELLTVPASTDKQRADVYHIRLANRRLRSSISSSFIRVIEDVPTECTDESMQKLASLVAIPEVGDKMTCLTMNSCKEFSTQKHNKFAHFCEEIDTEPAWLNDSLRQNLISVVQKAPRICHLICVLEIIRQTGHYYYKYYDNPEDLLNLEKIEDPLSVS